MYYKSQQNQNSASSDLLKKVIVNFLDLGGDPVKCGPASIRSTQTSSNLLKTRHKKKGC